MTLLRGAPEARSDAAGTAAVLEGREWGGVGLLQTLRRLYMLGLGPSMGRLRAPAEREAGAGSGSRDQGAARQIRAFGRRVVTANGHLAASSRVGHEGTRGCWKEGTYAMIGRCIGRRVAQALDVDLVQKLYDEMVSDSCNWGGSSVCIDSG